MLPSKIWRTLFRPAKPPPPELAEPLFPLASRPAPERRRAAPKPDGIGFFHVRTARDNWLAAGTPRACMTTEADGSRLIAIIPEANPQFLFLMAPDLRPIEIQSDGLQSVAISALRLQTDRPNVVRLRHPLAPARFMAVTRPGEGGPEGCVVFDSMGQTMLDAFLLVPAQDIPNGLRILATELAEAAARPFRAAPLLRQLELGVIHPALTEPLLRLLPYDELAQLAANPQHLALLRRLMPEDPWIATHLPALAVWEQHRNPAKGNSLVSPPEDERAGDPLQGFGQPQAGFVLTCLARARVSPHQSACILATARNEGPYLLEWLAYHRAAGFGHVFLYTNDNDDGSDDLLAALAQAGAITWVRNQRGTHYGPQYKAYAHALTMLPQILDYRWTAILDIDEYFAYDPRLFSGVADFLAWQETQRVDAVALCWLIFGAGGLQPYLPGPTLHRFTRREAGANQHVKTLFRTKDFWHAQAHFPAATLGAPFVYRTETGALHHHPGVTGRIAAFAEKPGANQAWINHYLLRTAPEALWKCARGLGDWPTATPERQAEFEKFVCRTFLTLAGQDLVEDTRIHLCAPGHGEQLERLLDIPAIADAEARIQARFAGRLERLRTAFLGSRRADEVPAIEKFRAILRQHALS